MREINDTQADRGPGLRGWWLPAAFLILALGVVLGRWAFPQEVVKVVTVEKEKRVEVPVERVGEKRVPVDRIVEKRVEVPGEVVKYVDRDASSAKTAPPAKNLNRADVGSDPWQRIQLGMTEIEVRKILGTPLQVEPGDYSIWWYGGSARVSFSHGKVSHWAAPSR
jgi:hypothetical protein